MNDNVAVDRTVGALDWLLNSLVGKVPGAERAVVLSADGLALAGSDGVSREDAEHLAAVSSALHSLARGVGYRFDKGQLRQTVVELDEGYLMVTEAGQGACVALLAGMDADLGLVAYEINVTVGQVRDQLSASPRSTATAPHVSYHP
ncbi:roadblock/LC7 domain-containing protein [Nocardia neocaledoniensis]|uniref:roadblock/LC7 domain-containing protein n=1 Tax=Nocardia neocaledoniensis TaxID=236511 RepID=UPI002456F756|nr:roadblock/LC7 domain-containing protein [Nocardia neocaledoniensis]